MKKKTTKGTDIKKTETPKTQYKEKKKKKKKKTIPKISEVGIYTQPGLISTDS